MAHAIHGYAGACKNIHGHSYELEVTVSGCTTKDEYILAPGFIIDFKELKQLVTDSIIRTIDHKLVLSQDYIAEHPSIRSQENLVMLGAEPTAENLLIHFQQILLQALPSGSKLVELKLYETKDSFARWIDTTTLSYY
ncbi:MAG: 6-carboxytetrahydropterin synthase [Ferruginibacter sp.]|nr:6-carboxytetrahydropterin synthase [Ferruginibacter sp.]